MSEQSESNASCGCFYYGDCPFVVRSCPVDEPWATCKHQVKPNKKDQGQSGAESLESNGCQGRKK